jgi:hypothetical protein
MFNQSISSSWTTDSQRFARYDGSNVNNYYYDAFEVIVSFDGDYLFTTDSYIDTYGYLYSDYFNPIETSLNLIQFDDDSGGNSQFLLNVSLQSNETYILVATTYYPSIIGDYTLTVFGQSVVNITKINIDSTNGKN